MRIYKQGDKVRILKTENFSGLDLSDIYAVGDICEVREDTDYDGPTRVYTKDESHSFCFAQDAIEPAEKTWDTLGQGDVLVDKQGNEAVVQGVIGEVVLYTSHTGVKDSEHAYVDSKLELQRKGYTIKQSEQTDTIEIDGKKYKKDEVAERLSELEPIE